jgi:hypothetical protein
MYFFPPSNGKKYLNITKEYMEIIIPHHYLCVVESPSLLMCVVVGLNTEITFRDDQTVLCTNHIPFEGFSEASTHNSIG